MIRHQFSCTAKLKIISVLLLLSSFNTAFAAIRYVTVTGAGAMDGTSWANAFPGTSLQNAINLSSSGDEVWVACGTYFTTTGTNRTIAFSMKTGVAIYGSFQGSETILSQRVLSCGPCSILSGEIGVAGIFDNSYHVVSNGNLDNTAILDGFVITGANDSRATTLTEGLGGGIYNQGIDPGNNSSPTIRNCVITNNRAGFGAGIFNSGYNSGNSNPVISHCLIVGNTALQGGGGIDNFGLSGNASPSIINCIIYGNTAPVAGGMYCWGGNPGGNSSPSILNCVFANNSATGGDAGGIICDNANSFNGASDGTSNPVIRNSIFRGNSATGAGPQFAIKGTGTFIATYSAIDLTNQLSPHIISGAGTGNIFTDPTFTNISDANGTDNCWMTIDDGLTVLAGSPAIDAGNNVSVPSSDLRFAARIQNGTVDIGAYETNDIILPLAWISFTGWNDKDKIRLKWVTAQEHNNVKFNIEKSADGNSFSTIGAINSTGNSTTIKNYFFTDNHPYEGSNFYRIKQEDIDNRFSYSGIIHIKYLPKNLVKRLVNPVAGRTLYVELTSFNAATDPTNEWKLFDMYGKNVANGKITSRIIAEEVPFISAGIYVLEIKVNGQTERIRLVK